MKENSHLINNLTSLLSENKDIVLSAKSASSVDYEEAYTIMNKIATEIHTSNAQGVIWFLEHPPTVTLGSAATESDILNSDFAKIVRTDRGGKVTYHGPGQRILYLMLNLKKIHDVPDVRLFVRQLEEVIILSLKDIGIDAFTREGRVGVWVYDKNNESKIAAIGLKIKKWVSIHGIAINIDPNLSAFQNIIPCGLAEFGITSIVKCGKKISMEEFDKILHTNLIKVFKIKILEV